MSSDRIQSAGRTGGLVQSDPPLTCAHSGLAARIWARFSVLSVVDSVSSCGVRRGTQGDAGHGACWWLSARLQMRFSSFQTVSQTVYSPSGQDTKSNISRQAVQNENLGTNILRPFLSISPFSLPADTGTWILHFREVSAGRLDVWSYRTKIWCLNIHLNKTFTHMWAECEVTENQTTLVEKCALCRLSVYDII